MREEIAGRCETCQHWSNDEEDYGYPAARFGRCRAIKQREEYLSGAVNAIWGRKS